MVLRIAAFLFSYWMSVIEAHQPSATSSVQRDRIIQPMRLFWNGWNPCNNETDPMTALGVDNQSDPVQIKQRV